MSFDQWEALPLAEQRHRLVLYLAQKEAEQDAIKRAQEDRFDSEMMRLAEEEG